MGKVLLILSLVLITYSCAHKDDIPFDSAKWKNWKESELEIRLRKDMLSDLLNQHHLIAMSKNKLYELLGTPDDISENSCSYYLGYSRNWGISTISLAFYFNSTNKVTSYKEYEG